MVRRSIRRVGLLSGWPWDIEHGGGTARYLLELEDALGQKGLEIVRIDRSLQIQDYLAFAEARVEWNRRLAADRRLRELDALFALDCDGSYLPPPPEMPPRIVCVQGVFAEIAETEPEPFRTALLLQAEEERRNLRTARAIVVPSEYTAACLAHRYGIDPARIDVVPHGFRLDAWRRGIAEAPKEPRSEPIILAVAGLYPRKGIATLLRAAALLGDLEPRPRVVVVGDGYERPRLVELAEELGISEHVEIEGTVTDRDRLASRFANADLFCLPSRHETFGFVFLEAMAAGLPVVASEAGAAPEVLGDAGMLVAVEDPDATARAIRVLLTQPEVAERVRSGGEARVGRFCWDQAADRYLEILDRVLAESG